jgi:hypothetical protein
LLVVPVFKVRLPLAPFSPTFAVEMNTSPESPLVLDPLLSEMAPPAAAVEEDPASKTIELSDMLASPDPAVAVMEPEEPDPKTSPVIIDTTPELPMLEVPDARETVPLAESILAFAVAKVSDPELFLKFAPLEIPTLPPTLDALEPACADM